MEESQHLLSVHDESPTVKQLLYAHSILYKTEVFGKLAKLLITKSQKLNMSLLRPVLSLSQHPTVILQ